MNYHTWVFKLVMLKWHFSASAVLHFPESLGIDQPVRLQTSASIAQNS
jgi:hypothetical protein